jgi:hypothetical protein
MKNNQNLPKPAEKPNPPAKLHEILTSNEYANLGLIKKTYAPDLLPDEFYAWVKRCHMLNVKIYQNEAFAIVYNKDNPAKRKVQYVDTFVLWNRKLRELPGFIGIKCHALYENDKFRMSSSLFEPEHEWDETEDRGKLIGAYAVIKIENQDPYYQFCKWSEFKKTGAGSDLHEKMPKHMIEKITKMNAARNLCTDMGNAYDPDELGKGGFVIEANARPQFPEPDEKPPIQAPAQEKKPPKRKGKKENLFAEPAQAPQAPQAPQEPQGNQDFYEMVENLFDEMKEKFGEKGAMEWLNGRGITSINDIQDVSQYKELREKWLERTE